MKRVTIVHFYRFLDDLGLFGEFWSEYYKIRNGRRMTLRERYHLHTLPPEKFVSSAFPWMYTDFGFDFWENINRRWLRHIGCKDSK